MALIKCPECGKDISDKSKVCIHCGYPLEEEQSEEVRYCTSCGTKNSIHDKNCISCGKSFIENNNQKATNTSISVPERKDVMGFASSTPVVKNPQPINHSQSVFVSNADENVARCPRCNSTSLSAGKKGFGYGKAVAGAVLVGGIGLLAGGIGANKTVITCLKCGYKFEL